MAHDIRLRQAGTNEIEVPAKHKLLAHARRGEGALFNFAVHDRDEAFAAISESTN